MPYGRSAAVRSHRRGGPRGRSGVTSWLVAFSVLALVAAGGAVGYRYLAKSSCSGKAQATVVADARIEPILRRLSQAWAQTAPDVSGTCASINITSHSSSSVARGLGGEWDVKSLDERPDVWVPESSAWVRKASVDPDAERIIPDLQPSLARTPAVIAMPRPLADAAGMTAAPLTWQGIVDKFASVDGWKAYGHPEWGKFRFGLTNPELSTTGLLALMAISDANDDGEVSPDEQEMLLKLKRVVQIKADDTADVFRQLSSASAQGSTQAMSYVSAFPALEQDVVQYNRENPATPLVAIYPKDGTAEADFPYLVLNAPWATSDGKAVATAFLRYIHGTAGRDAFKAAGMRDANRYPGPDLVAANGVTEKLTALPRAILLPESVQLAAATWTALTRSSSVLLVFDTSGSMAAEVPGTGKTRLDLTKAAAQNALSLFDDRAKVGLWSASTGQGSTQDYQKLLPVAALGGAEGGGRSHGQALLDAIDGLKAGGNTGLYNTTWAACQEAAAAYDPTAANLVVVLTDGADDNNVTGGLSLEKLIGNLSNTCGNLSKPVRVITVGLGVKADSTVLRQISAATGAATYSSRTAFDISQVLLDAIFTQ